MKKSNFLTYFTQKHKLTLRKVVSGDEVWHIFTTRGRIILISVLIFLVMGFSILALIIYTPIVDTIPGNIGNRQRDMLITSMVRIDSLEREVVMWENYISELQMVLDGRVSSSSTIAGVVDTIGRKQQSGVTGRSILDSMLRNSYLSLSKELSESELMRKSISFDMITPVSGEVSKRYDPLRGNFGIEIQTKANSLVLAVLDGTVILNSWSPDEGYVVGIQHSSSIITFYKGLQNGANNLGHIVRAGQSIGVSEGGIFSFEMWSSGNSVDPENFIHF